MGAWDKGASYPNIQHFFEIFLRVYIQLISSVNFCITFLIKFVIFAGEYGRKMKTWNGEERKAIATRRKELKKLASLIIGKQLINLEFRHSVYVTARNIKEILNQPHKHYGSNGQKGGWIACEKCLMDKKEDKNGCNMHD